ncbi:MAG: hypothetical protein ACFE8N_10725 [Promethearchaeota archaeon]
MVNKKKLGYLIIGCLYITVIGFIVPYLIINFRIHSLIFDYFSDVASDGMFFLLFVASTILFYPFIYSTITKGKLSLSIRNIKKKGRNPRNSAIILLVFGIPIMIWLIVGSHWYFTSTEFEGGFGIFAKNGFLVLLIIVIYFCVAPGIVLSLKKKKTVNTEHLN